MLKITVDASEIKGLAKVFATYRKAVRDGVKAEVSRAALAVQAGARRRAAVDTGRMRASIAPTFRRDGLGAEVATNTGYGLYVELGTRPHFPPPRALRGWARRVLGDEGKAFGVARAIARRGTRPRPFLVPAWEEERAKFERAIGDVLGKKALRVARESARRRSRSR